MITFTLPIPLSVNALFANIPGKGRVKTKAYKAWIKAAGWELVSQRPGHIEGPYRLTITLPEHTRGDIGNCEKCVSDLLVRHRIVEDDKLAKRITIDRSEKIASALIQLEAA